ncbi:MAG: hypothetical protein PVG14_13790 [Anaerolineales bacterium]|jgi:hypothetical protein
MFNDRDLGILGAGALLAVLCLVLPFPFAGKVVLGLLVLLGFVVLALLRLGPDRIPLEEWLRRRIRFHLQARRYTYQQPDYAPPRSRPSWRQWIDRKKRPRREEQGVGSQLPSTPTLKPVGSFQPVRLALDEIGVYPLATILMAVAGIYVVVWLAQGGAEEIALLIGGLF